MAQRSKSLGAPSRQAILGTARAKSQVRVLFEAPKLKGHLHDVLLIFTFQVEIKVATSWLTAAPRAVNLVSQVGRSGSESMSAPQFTANVLFVIRHHCY